MEEQWKEYIDRICREFEALHSFLTLGLSNAWAGEAFGAYLEAEDLLYREAMDALRSGTCEGAGRGMERVRQPHNLNEAWRP